MDLNKNTFDERLALPGEFLVDFWADWCQPCKTMLPVLEKVNSEIMPVYKVNVEEQRVLTMEYQVRSIPTMIIFSNGVEVKRIVGSQTFENMKKELT